MLLVAGVSVFFVVLKFRRECRFMKKFLWVFIVLLVVGYGMPGFEAFAQEEAAGAAAAAEAADEGSGSPGFFAVVLSGGFVGIILWLAIFGAFGAMVWFIVDCAMSIKEEKIMPEDLILDVTEAMEEGDILKALSSCEDEPGPMANILTAGFSHVEEGFEVIQESIVSAADLESEQMIQKIQYLSVVGNLAPMLGLLGTVQGMIAAFGHMGANVNIKVLAMDISQALYTTAAGLSIALPAVACFYVFRNKANRIILRMEGITIDLIKDLRNVEVVE